MGHARFQPYIRVFGLRFECQISARYPSSTVLTFLFWGLRIHEEKGYPYHQGVAAEFSMVGSWEQMQSFTHVMWMHHIQASYEAS